MKNLKKQVQTIFEDKLPTELTQHYKVHTTLNGGCIFVELADNSGKRVFGSKIDVSLQPTYGNERKEGVEISSASIRFTGDDAGGIATLYFLQRAYTMRNELEEILLQSDAEQRKEWTK